MSLLFTLDVTTDAPARRATLRLHDGDGRLVAAHEIALGAHVASRWEGVFDTRRHVERMKDVAPPEAQLAEIGRFLGEHVLGPEIARALAAGVEKRTLLVLLPDASDDPLAASFARVPWEIARAPGDGATLLARNVMVRAAHLGDAPAREAQARPASARDETVRVLLVFAERPGDRPLAARLERERLRALFFEEILPGRDVEVDVLCHGVTRRRIRDAVSERGGYHVVHWSGHGRGSRLRIAVEGGEDEAGFVGGEELVGLFSGAGGFVPEVVFLGACHSGATIEVKDWASLRASLGAGGETRAAASDPAVDKTTAEPPGFSGTALSLLKAGVKQVVAMRWDVGDTYARRLARRFYRRLLADRAGHAVDAALALARGELAADKKRANEYAAVDHATPIVLGGEAVTIEPRGKASAQIERRAPRPQPLLAGSEELNPPLGFVGRGEELTKLLGEWLGSEGPPIALIQGLAGLGKTSLAAEAIHLGYGRFEYVFAFQSKRVPLSIEELYGKLDQRLALASEAYRQRYARNEMERIYLAPAAGLDPAVREELLRNNLIDAFGSERILLVLDNFEANLLTQHPEGYACGDPAWDRLLEALGDRLDKTGSRLLVTSRHKLAALTDPEKVLWIPLGALPIRDAVLFFQGHRPLRELWYADDPLARRILDVSRGHPLILARIADLARAHHHKIHGLIADGRKALEGALNTMQADGFKTLPDVFVQTKSNKAREEERRYLEDVAIGAVDLLLSRLSPEARLLVWIVSRAGEPVEEDMISSVAESAPAGPLLAELCDAGLLVQEGDGAYAFHELVAERSAAWMEKHPAEQGGRTEADVWTAYGVRYGEAFLELREAAKREAASEAGRRGIRYLTRARAFDRLGALASEVVTGTHDPGLLGQAIADLRATVAEVPAGEAGRSLRTTLADALWRAGRPDQALPLFALAAEETEAAEHWSDLGWIRHNWAGAFQMVGQLDRAHATYLASAEAQRRAGRPRVNILTSELEALRVLVMQGRAEQALPDVEAKLREVRAFWKSHVQGRPVPEAPDAEALARTLVGGLGVACLANFAFERWQACLDLLGEIEEVKRARGEGEHEVARTRFNRYGPLVRLGKLAEAKTLLEGCLDVFRSAGDATCEAAALTALANVWSGLRDPAQAAALERRALAVRERLPDPGARAISHYNLALYLHATGAAAEAAGHELADLAYLLATGLDTRTSLRNLTVRIREAARGERFELPRLSDLLAAPAFTPLRDFLAAHGASPADLQVTIDAHVADIRSASR